MNQFFLKLFMQANTFLIHISRGRFGSKLGKQTILLIHSRGRKSGKEYITPIAYFPVNNGYYVIASNWGKPNNAAWYYNIKTQPRTIIEVKGRSLQVLAHEAQGEAYTALWENAVAHHPPYENYKAMTSRHIPIIVFEPQG